MAKNENAPKSRRTLVIVMIVLAVIIMLFPLFFLPGAEFGGSDDAGSDMVVEVTGQEYEPWFEPVLETLIGGELPGEIESLFFCIQTGIGVGIIAYSFG
ncbi:MAG: cobalt transport protein CbiN, partial [Coriobacteriales bacterium]|nr:cobalt transport protein CbiN [Coriobacteriales bacterium]